MKKFKIERDEFGDIIKYVLSDNIYIEREIGQNLTRTTSRYFLIKDNKEIKASGYGTGYSLKDLKEIALKLI